MKKMKSRKVRRKTKRVFMKLGTCSRTLFYILNREFVYPLENEERAVDLLAGGILQQGYQCGMLWGGHVPWERNPIAGAVTGSGLSE